MCVSLLLLPAPPALIISFLLLLFFSISSSSPDTYIPLVLASTSPRPRIRRVPLDTAASASSSTPPLRHFSPPSPPPSFLLLPTSYLAPLYPAHLLPLISSIVSTSYPQPSIFSFFPPSHIEPDQPTTNQTPSPSPGPRPSPMTDSLLHATPSCRPHEVKPPTTSLVVE